MTESLIEEEQIEVLEHAMDRTKQNQNWINQILAPNALSTVMNHRQTLLAEFFCREWKVWMTCDLNYLKSQMTVADKIIHSLAGYSHSR